MLLGNYNTQRGMRIRSKVLAKCSIMPMPNQTLFITSVFCGGVRCNRPGRELSAPARKRPQCLDVFLPMMNSTPISRARMFRNEVRCFNCTVLWCKPIPWHEIMPIDRRPTVPNNLMQNVFDLFWGNGWSVL